MKCFVTLSAFALAPIAFLANPILAVTPQASATQEMLDAYAKYQEWHFELRMTGPEKTQYQALLLDDFSRGLLRPDIQSSPVTVAKLAASDWLDISRFHSQQKQVDGIERSTTEMLNNGTISGNGLWASTMKEARSGAKSSAFLLKLIANAEKPLVGSGNIHDSLFPRDADALFEWTAFRYVMVTGTSNGIDASEAGRAAFRKALATSWQKARSDTTKLGVLQGQVQAAVGEWLVWRLADYSPYKRMSPFQQKSVLAQWATEILPAMPSVNAQARKRVDELKAYIAKMPDKEIKAEFDRKMRADAKFQATIQQMQGEMAATRQTFAQMRQSMSEFHVANLNIAENLGNSGYLWKMDTRP